MRSLCVIFFTPFLGAEIKPYQNANKQLTASLEVLVTTASIILILVVISTTTFKPSINQLIYYMLEYSYLYFVYSPITTDTLSLARFKPPNLKKKS